MTPFEYELIYGFLLLYAMFLIGLDKSFAFKFGYNEVWEDFDRIRTLRSLVYIGTVVVVILVTGS
jgi:hypothetical protein